MQGINFLTEIGYETAFKFLDILVLGNLHGSPRPPVLLPLQQATSA